MGIYLVVDWRLIGVLAVALVLFGLWFNDRITHLGEKQEGYTALLVAFGVTVTLVAVAVISWQSALLTLIAFVLSGSPMIGGDIKRAIDKRQQSIKRMQDEANDQA